MADNMTVSRAVLRLALSASREEEKALKDEFRRRGILGAAADLGGEFPTVIALAIERAIVAAKREGVIRDEHPHIGAVAGATREALSQVGARATGSSVGGKVAVARSGEHLAVAAFFGVSLVHLDDVAVAVAHRAVPE
jgi:hypothetical protein